MKIRIRRYNFSFYSMNTHHITVAVFEISTRFLFSERSRCGLFSVMGFLSPLLGGYLDTLSKGEPSPPLLSTYTRRIWGWMLSHILLFHMNFAILILWSTFTSHETEMRSNCEILFFLCILASTTSPPKPPVARKHPNLHGREEGREEGDASHILIIFIGLYAVHFIDDQVCRLSSRDDYPSLPCCND